MSTSSDALRARAEILKLARILQLDPAELAYLEPVSLADLRLLRDRTTEVLWSANSSAMDRLASASKLLPAGLTAAISERAFGPLLSARMAGRLEPGAAVAVAQKLPTAFLTDLAIELDPRRASAVISLIAPARIADVTRELVGRGDCVTMGRFVGHLGDEALVAALAVMDDPTLLRVAFVLEDEDELERLLALLPAPRLTGVVTAAVAGELWSEVLVIAEQDATVQGKLAERLLELPARQRRTIARQAKEAGLIDRLGSLGAALARL